MQLYILDVVKLTEDQGMYKGEGMAQVFLHYVDQNGPYKNHAYDQIGKTNE